MSFTLNRSVQQSKNTIKNTQQSKTDIFSIKTYQIKSAKKQSAIYFKLLIFQFITAFMNIVCIFVTAIVRQIKDPPQYLYNSDTIYLFLMLISIISAFFNLLAYKTQQRLNLTSQYKKYFNSLSHIIYMILSTFFYMIHPSHYIQHTLFYSSIPLNNILSFIVYLRVIPIVIFLIKFSKYYGLRYRNIIYRVDRVLNLYGKPNPLLNLSFTIKSLSKISSIRTMFTLIPICLTIFSLMIFSLGTQKNSSLIQRLYLCVISMTTVGYGDLYVHQFVDKILIIFLIIFGSFVSSMLTLIFLDKFQLSDNQSKAFQLIKRLQFRNEFNKQTIKQLQNAIIFKRNNSKQYKRDNQLSIKYLSQLHYHKPTLSDFYTQNYYFFKNSLQTLVEKEVLTNNLLKFLLSRLNKSCYQDNHYQNKFHRRVEDSTQIYNIKKAIILDQ